MIRTLSAFTVLATALVVFSQPSAPPAKTFLFQPSKGQAFNDIGSDDKTVPEPVDNIEIGKGVKAAFSIGDSVGLKSVPVKDWKKFTTLRADIVNPGKTPVDLQLNIFHARTKNFDTRTVVPLKLKPGKNEIAIGTDELLNVNGTPAFLSDMKRFYFSDEARKSPTVIFGDIWLEGSEMPAVPSGVAGPAPEYRIKGKIGGQDVDLVATPLGAIAPAAVQAAPVKGDPARVDRIRATKMPKVETPTLFNTPEADAVCSALEVFPPDNPWNLLVDDWPLHPNSKNIIASIGANKPFRYNPDMGFVLVPPDQKKIDVKIVAYAGESDKGPYPVPDNTPIEGWPVGYKGLSLDAAQRKDEGDADRHAIVVDPANRMLYEFYQMRKTDKGWQCACSAIFDLKSNKLRPDGWTSTDAAGLPIYPSIVRYDELKRGLVEHALRVTVTKTKREYVYPATHFASRLTDENLPRMGERIRLKKDVDLSGFSPEAKTILTALKRYGMLVADNGIDWAISVAPDPRIPDLHSEFRKLKGSDFEVVTPPAGYKPAE